MRYLVVSDLHGHYNYVNKLIDIIDIEQPDKIILLGDLYNHDCENTRNVACILNIYKDILLCTRGNCDTSYDEQLSKFLFQDSIRLTIGTKRFLFNHGHMYNINNIPNDIDVLIYGHLHTGFIKKINDILVINTGSIAYPRKGTANSYLLIDDNYIYLKNIDSNIIDYVLYN